MRAPCGDPMWGPHMGLSSRNVCTLEPHVGTPCGDPTWGSRLEWVLHLSKYISSSFLNRIKSDNAEVNGFAFLFLLDTYFTSEISITISERYRAEIYTAKCIRIQITESWTTYVYKLREHVILSAFKTSLKRPIRPCCPTQLFLNMVTQRSLYGHNMQCELAH